MWFFAKAGSRLNAIVMDNPSNPSAPQRKTNSHRSIELHFVAK
jgi:hypothetical protein